MLMVQANPFLIEGYLSPDFFCDRVEETALLTRHLTNRCNVALIAPRRLGKSGLIYHCFYQKEIREQYHCIYIDIYDTKNLGEFVYALGKGILAALKPKGRKVWEFFLNMLQSLKSTILSISTEIRNGAWASEIFSRLILRWMRSLPIFPRQISLA